MKKQKEDKGWDGIDRLDYWLGLSLNGFFVFFFILYIGKFGITHLILEGDTRWKIIFNIGVWYVLVMYTFDKFFEHLKGGVKNGKTKTKRKRN